MHFAGAQIVVYDLEFTAWEGSLERNWSLPWERWEVVQIGAVKLSVDNHFALTDEFEVLVKPAVNPVLSDYFVALTGIGNQRLKDRGIRFPDAVAEFAEFAGDADELCAFGADARVLLDNCAWNGMTWPLPAGAFRDIRQELSDLLGIDSASAESGRLWKYSGLPPAARPHDALADAKALATTIQNLHRQGRLRRGAALAPGIQGRFGIGSVR